MQEQYKMGLPTYQKPKGFWTPRASSNAANEVDARVCCCGAKAAAVPARRARVATVFMVRLKRLTMGSRKTGRSSISRKECSFGMSLHAWISLQLRDLFGVCTPPQPRYILCTVQGTVYTSTVLTEYVIRTPVIKILYKVQCVWSRTCHSTGRSVGTWVGEMCSNDEM